MSYSAPLAIDEGDHARGRRPAFRRKITFDLMCGQSGEVSCSGTHSSATLIRVMSSAAHPDSSSVTHFPFQILGLKPLENNCIQDWGGTRTTPSRYGGRDGFNQRVRPLPELVSADVFAALGDSGVALIACKRACAPVATKCFNV
eukprot:6183381-Pleurochrysis_carterae.AAC.6